MIRSLRRNREAGTRMEMPPSDREIDPGKIEARLSDSLLKRVIELIERNPQRAFEVLRRWLSEGRTDS